MLLLAVETSHLVGSLALIRGDKLLGQKVWNRAGSHSEFVTTSLQELLNENGLQLSNVNRIATGLGPGSFTGIRVAINFARSLGYALNIPIFPMNSLRLTAYGLQQKVDKPICVAQYAFRDIYYVATYQQDFHQGHYTYTEVLAPQALTAQKLSEFIKSPHVFLGTVLNNLKVQAPQQDWSLFVPLDGTEGQPQAKNFIHTQALDDSPGHLTDWIHTIPLYIRASEAEEKLKN